MYCPECGTEAAEAHFCPECGSDLTPMRTEECICPGCGTDAGAARFCPECGQQVGTEPGSQRGAGASPAPAGQGRGSRLKTIAAVVGIAAFIAVLLVIVMGPGEESAVAETVAVGDQIEIPLQDLAGGEARFYTYDVSGVPVKYFVMQSPDGEYRAALDASKECGPSKKGFRQEGTDMVCNECGERFASVGINVLTGECNPLSIERKVVGESLVLETADLEPGVKYFQ